MIAIVVHFSRGVARRVGARSVPSPNASSQCSTPQLASSPWVFHPGIGSRSYLATASGNGAFASTTSGVSASVKHHRTERPPARSLIPRRSFRATASSPSPAQQLALVRPQVPTPKRSSTSTDSPPASRAPPRCRLRGWVVSITNRLVPRFQPTAELLRYGAHWALLIVLAFGPVGLGATITSLAAANCTDSCDCTAVHDGHARATTVAANATATNDDCGGQCPPDCPDCACCPGLAPGLRPALRVDPSPSRAGLAPQLNANSPAIGDSPDFFRPPRRLA